VKRAELYALLDERAREPDRAADIDASIWQEAGAERAVLVSDLSGFTRITRHKGILHFLCAFRREVALAAELLPRCGATFWAPAADNLMAAFPTVDCAINAAVALATADLGEVTACLGIAWGRILVLEDDLFGDAVNVAYKLGEDVAEPRQVLVSAEAVQRVTGQRFEGPCSVELGGIVLPYFQLRIGG
jgi:class 3 adenylate cyclase